MLYDLRIDPKAFEPWNMSVGQLEPLTALLADKLRFGGCSYKALAEFDPVDLAWEIPGRRMEFLDNVAIGPVGPKAIKYRMWAITSQFERWIKQVRKHGVDRKLLNDLSEQLQVSVKESFITINHNNDELFAAQLVLLLAPYGTRFVSDKRNLYMRVKTQEGTAPMGICDGKLLGRRLERLNLDEFLNQKQGTVWFGTFSVLDRARLWVEKFGIADQEKILLALATLKMLTGYEASAFLERELIQFGSMPVIIEATEGESEEVVTQRELLFDEENLEFIRKLWVNPHQGPRENYREVYDAIVPAYMDHNGFMRMFGVVLTSKKLNFEEEDKVSRGMEKFVRLFAATASSLKNGKRLRMTK